MEVTQDSYAVIMGLNDTYGNRQLKNNFETNGAPYSSISNISCALDAYCTFWQKPICNEQRRLVKRFHTPRERDVPKDSYLAVGF